MDFIEILQNIPEASFQYSSSRTSNWRRKVWKVKPSFLYFWIWLSFNIDWNRQEQKQIYQEKILYIKSFLKKEQIEFIVKWLDKNYYKISKNVAIKEVNSKWKLLMHLIFILPYIKKMYYENDIQNLEGFIARVLFNCTRSWYTNFCKRKNLYKFWENQ